MYISVLVLSPVAYIVKYFPVIYYVIHQQTEKRTVSNSCRNRRRRMKTTRRDIVVVHVVYIVYYNECNNQICAPWGWRMNAANTHWSKNTGEVRITYEKCTQFVTVLVINHTITHPLNKSDVLPFSCGYSLQIWFLRIPFFFCV